MSRGKCNICGKEYTGSGIQTHLRSCLAKTYVEQALTDQCKNYFWIGIKDAYNDDFWLHILIEQEATLELLDAFLRGIWLECCGHLSEFRIGDMSFASSKDGYGGSTYGMDVAMHKMMMEKDVIHYTYDFGSSTELTLTVKRSLEEVYGVDSIILIARNNAPDYTTGNSPRVGVCGYEEDLSFDPKTLKSEDYPAAADNRDVYEQMAYQRSRSEVASMLRKIQRSGSEVLDSMVGQQMETFKKGLETYMGWEKSKKIVDMLNQFTGNELDEMAYLFEITLFEDTEKSETVQRLASSIPKVYLTHIQRFDSENIRVLKGVFDGGGICKADQLQMIPMMYRWVWGSAMSMLIMAVEGDEEDQVDLIIPDEIFAVLEGADWKHINRLAKQNDQWLRYMRGLLYYYGVMTIEDLLQEVVRLDGPIEDDDLFRVVINNAVILGESYEMFDDYVVFEGVIDPQEIIREISLRTDIDRKHMDKKEVLLASDEDYIPRNRAVKKFEQFLRGSYDADKESIEDYLLDIYDLLDEGMPVNELVDYTASRFEVINSDVMKEFMDHIVRVYNNRRQWQLKGHTPNELMRLQKNKSHEAGLSGKVEHVDFVAKKKIGRNDPCPCGSGLKYKWCCLNKQP